MTQLEAQLEGLAIGLEQRGEKSAAHICRLVLAEIERLNKIIELKDKQLVIYKELAEMWSKTSGAILARIRTVLP